MFKPNSLFYSDGYKVGHKRMLAEGVKRLYGTWIPRSLKHAPEGITKIVSFGQQLTWQWINDEFDDNFFNQPKEIAIAFGKDMSMYLGMDYDSSHFEDLHDLSYLPIKVKALPEGIETEPNIPHMTFINTVDGYAWLTLYLETIISSLAWKPSTSATIALKYKRNATEWVMKTDPEQAFLIDYMCHDFSARGLDPWSMLVSGLGHSTSFRGSDSIICIPAARYFYNEPENEVCINSVNASEHSVSTTKIFTVGEKQMIIDWLKEFPTGILSIVADTFDLWKLLIEYITDPEVRGLIMSRDGKLVIRPDSGDPVDIICGFNTDEFQTENNPIKSEMMKEPSWKGVIELLWDAFGGTTNESGYKVLDSHIGAIYGDAITLERQVQIYSRLADKKFAATNIVLGVGSFTYQFNTRDTLGFAAKGGWFETEEKAYNIFKDPVTDDGTKKSYKGLLSVGEICSPDGKTPLKYVLKDQCTWEEEESSLLQIIYEDGFFHNQTTLTEIREKINSNFK